MHPITVTQAWGLKYIFINRNEIKNSSYFNTS